jgi:hypothetical protein
MTGNIPRSVIFLSLAEGELGNQSIHFQFGSWEKAIENMQLPSSGEA